MSDYTYARHIAWMQALLIDHLDLMNATFFGQDWGGLVGLRVVTAAPDRFDRIVVGNTGLPTGEQSPGAAFLAWQKFSQTSPRFDIGSLINAATTTELSEAEIAAYDAPFPDDSYKAGARIFPTLVPTSTHDPESPANIAAWKVLEQWHKPFVCCFSDSDPITGGGDAAFLKRVPGAKGQPHITATNAHHFFQEDASEQLSQLLIDVIG
jgi:haloalkane dehalogenase